MTEDTVAGRGLARNTVGFTTPRLERLRRRPFIQVRGLPMVFHLPCIQVHQIPLRFAIPEIVAVVGNVP